MSLAPEDLATEGEVIIGRELVPATFALSLAPPTRALSRVRKLQEAAGHLAKTVPDILAMPEVARATEQALVEAMVFCLTDSHSDQVCNVRGPSRESDAAPGKGADGEPRGTFIHGGTLGTGQRVLLDTA